MKHRTDVPSECSNQITDSRLGGRIRILETWFDDMPGSSSGFDLLICHQRSKPLSARGWLYFYTILIDLTVTAEELLNQMNKTTVREIKRARDKDKLHCTMIEYPTQNDIDEYATLFDANPRVKGQLPIDRDRFIKLNNAGLLQISRIQMEDGTDLLWRCNLAYQSQQRVQPISQTSLLHMTSDRDLINLIGRANRMMHYSEMLYFKKLGYLIYDFNGWYAGTEDEKRLQINQFKEGFGGRIVYGYDCEEPLTWRGWMYIVLRSIKRRILQPDVTSELRRRRQKAPRLSES